MDELKMKPSSIHDAVVDAAFESACEKERPCRYVPTSVRLGESGHMAAQICHQNGTTLAKFLRNCCAKLVEDYGG